MAKRRGRPSLPGKRKPSGRLRKRAVTVDYGNKRAQELRAAFAIFQSGKAGNDLGDGIGKAWAAGLLDGFAADAQAMRDAGRDYGGLWRIRHGALGVRTSSPERRARVAPSASAMPNDALGRRFERMDSVVSEHDRVSREAFFGLCVDYQDSDNVPPFVERLINERMMLKGRKAAGPMPVRGDLEKLERAAGILADLVGGGRR
jgi:hypothetical protein